MTEREARTPFKLRAPCGECGGTDGFIVMRNGQDVAYCATCHVYAYCVPRTESGREVRRLRTRPDIKPSQRSRVFMRDGNRCVFCGATAVDAQLDVGHILDVSSGRSEGLTDAELFDDENLAVLCGPCNSGIGSEPMPLRLAVGILRARTRR